MTPGPRCLKAAIEYAQRGWPVFPIHWVTKGQCSCGTKDCPNCGKHPMTEHGLNDATTDQKMIQAWFSKWPLANVGIATGAKAGIVVLDIDPRHGGNESLKKLSQSGNLPVYTPSVHTGGGGEHLIMAHPGKRAMKNRQNVGKLPGIDFKADGGYIVAVPSNHVSGGKYSWKINHMAQKLANVPDWLYKILTDEGLYSVSLSSSFKNSSTSNSKFNAKNNGWINLWRGIGEGERDVSATKLAGRLLARGLPDDEVLEILACWNQRNNPPLTDREISKVVKSIDSSEIKKHREHDRVISDEVREWVLTTTGNFLTTDIQRELDLATKDHKKAANMALLRLEEEGIVTKCGTKRGCYRKIEGDAPRLRLCELGKMGDELTMIWPFGIENYFRVLPKTLVVVAGAKDAGKTAFMLNVARLNMHSEHGIFYFTSEMGLGELADRIGKFDHINFDEWDKKVKMYERADNFPDVIKPDAINIIDYLEISDNFYLVNEMLRNIWKQLRKGVAIVALQKRGDSEWGRGGEFSAEKARLYLTLNPGKKDFEPATARIVAAKNWRKPTENPKGKTWQYKLVKGCHFKIEEYNDRGY
jgi:hypothetical protein